MLLQLELVLVKFKFQNRRKKAYLTKIDQLVHIPEISFDLSISITRRHQWSLTEVYKMAHLSSLVLSLTLSLFLLALLYFTLSLSAPPPCSLFCLCLCCPPGWAEGERLTTATAESYFTVILSSSCFLSETEKVVRKWTVGTAQAGEI